jgi:predicted nucleotidyltransferase
MMLTAGQAAELRSILATTFPQRDVRVGVFGSRASGPARPDSDLDIVLDGNVPAHVVMHLQESLEQSDLPFAVDLVQYRSVSADFRRRIDAQRIDLFY